MPNKQTLNSYSLGNFGGASPQTQTPGPLNGALPGMLSTNGAAFGYGVPRREDFDSDYEGGLNYANQYAYAMMLRWNTQAWSRNQLSYKGVEIYKAYDTVEPPELSNSSFTDGMNQWTVRETHYYVARLINKLWSNFSQRELDLACKAINHFAKGRMDSQRAEHMINVLRQGINKDIITLLGQPPQMDMQQRTMPEELEHFDKSYKDQYAHEMEGYMREWLAETNYKDNWRQTQYLWYLLTDCFHAWPQVDPNTLQVSLPYIAPWNFIPDFGLVRDDFFSDANFGMWFDYTDLYHAWRKWPVLQQLGKTPEKTRSFLMSQQGKIQQFYGLPGIFLFAENSPQTYQIMYAKMWWRETGPKTFKRDYQVSRGIQYEDGAFKHVMDKKTKKYDAQYDIIHTATFIGGRCVEYKEDYEWTERSVDAPAYAKGLSVSCINGYSMGRDTPPRMIRVAAWSNFRNLLMQRYTQMASGMQASKLAFDPSVLWREFDPALKENENIKDQMELLITSNIIPCDLQQLRELFGNGAKIQDFITSIDLNQGNILSMEALLKAVAFAEAQIRDELQLPMGQVEGEGEYTTATVAQLNAQVAQSGTAGPLNKFLHCEKLLFNKIGNLLALTHIQRKVKLRGDKGKKELFSMYMKYGDSGANPEAFDAGLALQDYGFEIIDLGNRAQAAQQLKQMMPMVLEGKIGPEELEMVGVVVGNEGFTEIMDGLKELARLRKAEATQAQQQQMQVGQSMAQMQEKHQKDLQDAKNEAEMQRTIAKINGELANTLLKELSTQTQTRDQIAADAMQAIHQLQTNNAHEAQQNELARQAEAQGQESEQAHALELAEQQAANKPAPAQ